MKIDVSKLDIALAHKEATNTCPFCTRREWTTDDTPTALTPADPDADEPVEGAGMPAAVMVCTHCGFVRLHALDVLFRGDRPVT
jgi:hypothetical protein